RSPLRGEGDGLAAFGPITRGNTQERARRRRGTSAFDLVERRDATPSPLNGERAGVRGENSPRSPLPLTRQPTPGRSTEPPPSHHDWTSHAATACLACRACLKGP